MSESVPLIFDAQVQALRADCVFPIDAHPAVHDPSQKGHQHEMRRGLVVGRTREQCLSVPQPKCPKGIEEPCKVDASPGVKLRWRELRERRSDGLGELARDDLAVNGVRDLNHALGRFAHESKVDLAMAAVGVQEAAKTPPPCAIRPGWRVRRRRCHHKAPRPSRAGACRL